MSRRPTFPAGGLRVQILAIALAAALVGAIVGLVSALDERRQLETEAERDLLRLTRSLAAREEQRLDAIVKLLTALSLLPELRDPRPPHCSAALGTVAARDPVFARLEVAAPDGTIVCRSARIDAPSSVANDAWFRAARDDGFAIGGVVLEPASGRAHVPLAVSARDEHGTVGAVLIARLDVASIARLTAGLDLPPATSLTVLDTNGRIVYRQPDVDQFLGQRIEESELGRAARTRQEDIFVATGLDGVRRVYAAAALPEGGSLFLGVPVEIMYASAAAAFSRELFVLAVALVATLGVVWVAVDLLVGRPLRRLTATTQRLADGDFSARTGLSAARNEIGRLARAFDSLAAELEQRDRRIQEQLADLRRSNAELEQFASVVSHDLREPLRSIAGFTRLLARRYRGQLDADANEFIEYITAAVDRMNALITDLLAYSRVVAGPRSFQPIDSSEAAARAIDNLRGQIAASGARLTVGALPIVRGDLSQLVQVFQNLIGNALKYRSDLPPEIVIDAAPAQDLWRFWVQDNGIGIAPEDAERVFGIFQRLHPRTASEGTGIGLAICKAVIERHGGRIWVEPSPTGGTIVHFTLPAAAAEAKSSANGS
ncbi:MAG: hypothetical protein KatS3mg060_0064 [Dehalococcoidia bacterium]|nr:MAG: hypothetical protein KatS3mg060_0064 [Dehalococcoidia bacterium]